MPTELSGTACILISLALAWRYWPAGRPIEIIMPFAPGADRDVMARTVAPFLSTCLPGTRSGLALRALRAR